MFPCYFIFFLNPENLNLQRLITNNKNFTTKILICKAYFPGAYFQLFDQQCCF